ncbi:MAG TPA: DUF1080 domain-containing protein [Pirellulales bacterium]|jgi:hypothetical protein|nr:DUF1080 domain-containing protein [Pirellulales bacterium]
MNPITLCLPFVLLAVEADRSYTSPKSPSAEYGHGLTAQEANDGWISLFDGRTTFGWNGSIVAGETLIAGETTSFFGSSEIRADVVRAGKIVVGDRTIEVTPGRFATRVDGEQRFRIRLAGSVGLRTLTLRPLKVVPIFNGKDLSGWTIIRAPRTADAQQTQWSVSGGAIHALGGRGALESAGRYGDVVVQVVARTRARLVNGGLFFRAMPGQLLNGYEAQIFNACYHEDPSQPARYSTGAIDDRQLARRLVSRDLEPFTMMVIAVGPHIATWVNGCAMTDWIDTRQPHDNPRQGLRLEPGTIQLQAHDPETDLEFQSVRIGEIK